MSRIGKKPIIIPEGVEVKIDGQKVTVKGPKGGLTFEVSPQILVELVNGSVKVSQKREDKNTRALWGLTRSLIFNMVKGVSEGYEKKLELEGIGFKANVEGKKLTLNVGFTHPVVIEAPEGINFSVEKNVITVSGIDKQLVGETAARIRKVRPPEPYKGKGIRYQGEVIRRKEGKKAATAAAA